MSDDIEPDISPLWVLPPTMPRWDSKEAGHMIADPSLTPATAQRQIQRYASLKWIPAAGRGGRGRTNLFSPTAVATAKVLSVLNDLGIEDHETMGPAAVQLAAWNDDQPIVKGLTPVLAAVRGAVRGQFWVFQVTMFRGDQTGARRVRAWVYNPDKWHPSSSDAGGASEMMPRASVTLHLTPILLPLHKRMLEAAKATEPAN